MEVYLEALVASVTAKSATFAQHMRLFVPSIICDVGHYSNEAFLLRSFVSLRADNNGDELALTVDITRPQNGSVSVESEVCMANGTILAAGPAVKLSATNPNSIEAVSAWTVSFDEFLVKSTPDVAHVLSEMVAVQENSMRKALDI